MPSGEMTDGRCDTVAIVNGQRLIFIVANGPISRSLPIRRFNAVRGGRGGTLHPFYCPIRHVELSFLFISAFFIASVCLAICCISL